MIVDDETIFRKGLRKMIASLGREWQVIGEAQNGVEALKRMEQACPDLLITDIRMPLMDGIQLQRVVKNRFPHTACIVLSGHDEFAYARESLKAGARDYLLKPIERQELHAALEQVKQERLAANRDNGPSAGREQKEPDTQKPMGTSPVEQAIRYVREHFANEMTLGAVADLVHLNPSYFSTLFKQKTGTSFIEFLLDTRIEAAKKLLLESDRKIQEIADSTGFSNIRHFNRVFKMETGLTPKEYRRAFAPGQSGGQDQP